MKSRHIRLSGDHRMVNPERVFWGKVRFLLYFDNGRSGKVFLMIIRHIRQSGDHEGQSPNRVFWGGKVDSYVFDNGVREGHTNDNRHIRRPGDHRGQSPNRGVFGVNVRFLCILTNGWFREGLPNDNQGTSDCPGDTKGQSPNRVFWGKVNSYVFWTNGRSGRSPND